MTKEIDIKQLLDDILENMACIMPNVLTVNDFHAKKFDISEMNDAFKYLEKEFNARNRESTYRISLGFDVNLDIYPCLKNKTPDIYKDSLGFRCSAYFHTSDDFELDLPYISWNYCRQHLDKIKEFIKNGTCEPFICCSLSIKSDCSTNNKYYLKCDVHSSEFETFIEEMKSMSVLKILQFQHQKNQDIIEENEKEREKIEADSRKRKRMSKSEKEAAEKHPIHKEKVKAALHSCGFDGYFKLEVTYASYGITLKDSDIAPFYVMQDNYEEEIRKNLEGKEINY